MTAAAKQIVCQQCGTRFAKTAKCKPYRKYCSRECYRQASRRLTDVAYPQIWHNGRREYLHRVIYMQTTGEILTPNDIIHHRDGDPFNRDPANLQKINGRLEHLREHNFHRGRSKPAPTYDEDFGF